MVVAYPQPRPCPYQLPAAYDTLRDGAPMHRVRLFNGGSAWLVSRYDIARRLLADRRLSSDRGNPGFPVPSPRFQRYGGTPPTLVRVDQPEHGQARRMV